MMKKIFIFTIASLILYSCSENTSTENNIIQEQKDSINALKSNHASDSISFTFNSVIQSYAYLPGQAIEIKGKKGTIIKIPKDILVYDDGTLPQDSVYITIKECYDAFDIVCDNLSTQTKEQMLETGGMVHISAQSKKGMLKLKDNKNFSIGFPLRGKYNKGMKLFKGIEDKGAIVWNKILDEEPDEIKLDSIFQDGYYQPILNKELDKYLFRSIELGWLNCDRILEENNTLANAVYKGKIKPSMYIFFKKIDAVAYGFNEDDKITFYNIPPNEQATIIGFYKLGNDYYYYKEDVVVKENMQFVPVFKKTTLPELEAIIRDITWLNEI